MFHCWARGVDRRPIYADDADYNGFMECLENVLRESRATLVAYCLMPNHFHLLIQVRDTPLSVIMQRVLTLYARRFNKRHNRVGHLFQERFRERLCSDNAYLARIIPYIHLNPVRGRLVASPEKWKWSSQHAYPLDSVDLTGFNPWEGSEERKIDLSRSLGKERNSLENILSAVSATAAVHPELVRSACKVPVVVAARRTAVIKMLDEGYTASAIGRFLGISHTSICRFNAGRIEQLHNLTP
jgi:REP element-mobilizing transposase RayT/uncharacterized protein YerC